MKYELWYANERFIMGKKIRTYKSLESALKRAKKDINYTHTDKNFKEDISLELPFNFTMPGLAKLRNIFYKRYRGREGYFKIKEGNPPIWEPEGWLDKTFLKFKDWLCRPIVEKAIYEYHLYDFYFVHFESGMDFLKNEFFV